MLKSKIISSYGDYTQENCITDHKAHKNHADFEETLIITFLTENFNVIDMPNRAYI